MNKQDFFKYLRTFLLTILFAFVAIFAVLLTIQYRIYNSPHKTSVENMTIDYYLVGVLIEKNKYWEQKDPTNYFINLKLGVLYELKKDYRSAEIEYKEAIAKAPYDVYAPKYKLALLYLATGRLQEAENIVQNIDERPNKRLIAYKGEIYNRLGDKYYNKGDYETAGLEYQKSLFYYSKINSDQVDSVKDSLASSYVYLADKQVASLQIQDAIESLKMALTIINAPIIKYKLGLLLMKDHPDLAYKYFQEVFTKEPSIIDYDTYYRFLSALASEADMKGDTALADLYQYKIKQLKDYYASNILSVEDIATEAETGSIKYSGWSKKYNINLEFKLKNISEYPMKSLFIDVVFKDGKTKIDEYTKQIADDKSQLKAFAFTPIISLRSKLDKTDEDKFPKVITADIYVSKAEDSYKIFLKQVKIVEKTRPKEIKFKSFSLKSNFLPLPF